MGTVPGIIRAFTYICLVFPCRIKEKVVKRYLPLVSILCLILGIVCILSKADNMMDQEPILFAFLLASFSIVLLRGIMEAWNVQAFGLHLTSRLGKRRIGKRRAFLKKRTPL